MVSEWTNFDVKSDTIDKFKDLCDLWKSLELGQTASPEKLTFKINSTYEQFTDEEREQFTKYVLDHRIVSQELIDGIIFWRGIIKKPVSRWEG